MTFINTKGVIDDEVIKDNSLVGPFSARFNEVRCIANIYKLLAIDHLEFNAITRDCILLIKEILGSKFNYLSESLISYRFELLKDYIWLFTSDNELLDLIYNVKPKNKSQVVSKSEVILNQNVSKIDKYKSAEKSQNIKKITNEKSSNISVFVFGFLFLCLVFIVCYLSK